MENGLFDAAAQGFQKGQDELVTVVQGGKIYLSGYAESAELGTDPELSPDGQVLMEVGWKRIGTLSEIDRAFVWGSGLIAVSSFQEGMH